MPCITGLAQATVRSDATMDSQYVKKVKFINGLKIIILKVSQVFGKGGN